MKLNENWAVKIGVVVLILATSYPPVNAQEPNTPTALGILDQLAHVYHGVPVDRDFKEISLSNEAIAAGLKSYVVKFGGQVVGTPASKFRDAKRRLEQKTIAQPGT